MEMEFNNNSIFLNRANQNCYKVSGFFSATNSHEPLAFVITVSLAPRQFVVGNSIFPLRFQSITIVSKMRKCLLSLFCLTHQHRTLCTLRSMCAMQWQLHDYITMHFFGFFRWTHRTVDISWCICCFDGHFGICYCFILHQIGGSADYEFTANCHSMFSI